MKRMICLLFLALAVRVFPLVTDYTPHAPIKAWSQKPQKEHFYVMTYYQQLTSERVFTAQGELTSLSDYLGIANVNPQLGKSILVADISLGLTPAFGVQVIAPYIASHQLAANSDTDAAEEDIVGDTGFGDVDVGVWFAPQSGRIIQYVFGAMYHISSGSSPYKVSSTDGISGGNQPLSTGLGYSYLSINAKIDAIIMKNLTVSFLADYRHNHLYIQNGYEPTSRKGDVYTFAARAVCFYKPVTLSLAAYYSDSFDNIDDRYLKKNTGISQFSLLPQVGVSVPLVPFVDIIHLGYAVPISGKNMIFSNYVLIGIDFSI